MLHVFSLATFLYRSLFRDALRRFSVDVFGWFVQLTDSGISGDHVTPTQVCLCMFGYSAVEITTTQIRKRKDSDCL